MAAVDFDTASVHSDTASEFSDRSTTAAPAQTTGGPLPRSHLYTCLSCHVAFHTADQQRDHMRTDWHRYNLKRKVAELPPIHLEDFVERIKAAQIKNNAENERKGGAAGDRGQEKTYSSENAYTNHISSKKHKEAQARYDKSGGRSLPAKKDTSTTTSAPIVSAAPIPSTAAISTSSSGASSASSSYVVVGSSSSSPHVAADVAAADAGSKQPNWKQQFAGAKTEEELLEIMERKAETAVRLEEGDCLFCSSRTTSFESNMEHMAKQHSFFIPDIEYLVDAKALIKYLGEKVAIANVCLYCNGKGRAMHSLEAVRKHMVDKGHCKILYEDGAELEVADFYDFSSTYPDEAESVSTGKGKEAADEEWEDIGSDDEEELGDMSNAPGAVRITNDETQLILPSGVRIGHRSYRKYWNQSLKTEDTRDAHLIHRLSSQYAMLGYEKTPYEVAVAHHQRRMQARAGLERHKEFRARVGVKHNMLQKHFRSQIGFGV
ncbi:hypothetical protein HK104_006066 [Borealophlyctis nickersoniae]|nr:hypothetical protein HK104_006066 [Borealophlyctis nickersoniae]